MCPRGKGKQPTELDTPAGASPLGKIHARRIFSTQAGTGKISVALRCSRAGLGFVERVSERVAMRDVALMVKRILNRDGFLLLLN